jgi:hypothetical protein
MKKYWTIIILGLLILYGDLKAQVDLTELKINTDSLRNFLLTIPDKTQPIPVLFARNLDDQQQLSREIHNTTSLDSLSKQDKALQLIEKKTIELEIIINLIKDDAVKPQLLKNTKNRRLLLQQERKRLTNLAKALKAGVNKKVVQYSFFSYSSEKELGSQGFEKQKNWDDFRNKNKLNRIDELVTSSEYSLTIECSDILNIGICITSNTFERIQIKSLLKTVLKKVDEFSDEYLSAFDEEFTRLMKNNTSPIKFIDLRPLFIKAYRMKADSLAGCCPDKIKDFDLELREKLCSVAEFDHGLEITLSGKTESKTFGLKTIGNKRKRSSNEQVPTLEPRQYVTIYEREKNKQSTTPIWWLVKRDDDLKKDLTTIGKNYNDYKTKFYTSQKHRVVDKESILEIKFDQEALAQNINFYGNISLAAKIGNRAIEVTPYSLVGKPQRSYGVNSKPILEIADNFFRLMIEAKNAEIIGATAINRIKVIVESKEKSDKNALESAATFASILSEFKTYFNKITNGATDTLRISDNNDLDRFNQIFLRLSPLLKDDDKNKLEISIQQRKIPIKEVSDLNDGNRRAFDIKTIKSGFEKSLKQEIETGAWADFIRHAEKAVKYMTYFTTTSDDSKSAFLRLIMLTEIDFSENYLIVKDVTDYFKANDPKPIEDTDFYKQADRLAKAFKDISLNSQEFTRILNEYGYGNNFNEIKKETSQGKSSIFELLGIKHSLLENLKWKPSLLENPQDYKKIRERIAQFAGQIIFSKLLYGTIDLKKQSVNDGDEIEIAVMWYNIDETTTTAEQGVELATTKFLVKKTGWHLDVSESALLIHRIDEDKLRSGYPISPSNFKPTAGASLLWSYYNPFRTVMRIKKCGSNKGQYKEYGFLKFLHWVEPSLGINVSYLDFRTDRDFEFGAGPVMGLFQNRIFLTTGYNFSVNGESPFYMGIGFSFSNIYKRINRADYE